MQLDTHQRQPSELSTTIGTCCCWQQTYLLAPKRPPTTSLLLIADNQLDSKPTNLIAGANLTRLESVTANSAQCKQQPLTQLDTCDAECCSNLWTGKIPPTCCFTCQQLSLFALTTGCLRWQYWWMRNNTFCLPWWYCHHVDAIWVGVRVETIVNKIWWFLVQYTAS
jgi:hypothetical protein